MTNQLKVSDLIKKVIASGDKVELEKLKNQLRNQFVDVFGEQVSLYEIYFQNNQ
jgi:hypothetical protein